MASLMLLQFSRTIKSTLSVPAIDIVDRKVLAIGRGCAVNDDAFDLSCHTAMMAEDIGRNKAEGRPQVGFGRMGLKGYVGFKGLSN
ncbi:hypothetical protein [Nitrosomonas sp. Nm132]|uniref:hypothetical protein n=1 Tax=Nitrosomonas sp. Nm132 TaxID=1881053 RepID=UPI000885B713|nr:hypothetical protein [Nitrosomonas sp. Nm132]SDH26729.1 hypothetical protein SAMN05428952_100955 [Nitrosomonas sp. Nm132]